MEMVRRGARQVAGELVQVRESLRALEVCEVDLVAELVDVYDSVPESMVAGAERMVPAGHAGTPLFAEFLIAELAPILECSVEATRALVSDVLDLRERLPLTWRAVHEGRIVVWQARKVAQATGRLTPDACRGVDAALAPTLGLVAWPRVRRKLAGLIVAADPEDAARDAERKRSEQCVRIVHEPGGMSTLVARLRTENALVLANAINAIAKQKVTDGYPGPVDQARADALVGLALPSDAPGRLPRPEATIVVHVAPGSPVARTELIGATAARGEGEIGPVLLGQVRDLLQHHRVRLLPVIDLADDPHVDAYEIPAGMRRHLAIRDGCEVFPFSSRSAWGLEADHTRSWPTGESRPSNLGSLSRFIHRVKTHGDWGYEQPEPGVFELTSPLGYRYRQSRQGTAQVRYTEHIPPQPIAVDIDFDPRPDLPPRPKAG